MLERLPFLRRRHTRPTPPGPKEIDQHAVERTLNLRCAKDSFDTVEDLRRELARGVVWRRRRLGWADVFTGEDMGLCVNELRLEPGAQASLRPSIAMAQPNLFDFDSIEFAYWATAWASAAKREEKGRKSSRLFLNMRSLTCSRSGAPRGPWEDLRALQDSVRKGEWTRDQLDLLPTMSPVLREEGDTTLEVARYLPANPPSWNVQAESQVLAASNGGYFLNFPEEYEDDLSALHQPLGALVADGELQMPPWIERPCALQWADGVAGIELLGPQDITLAVDDGQPFELAVGPLDPRAPATVWRFFDEQADASDDGVDTVDLVFSGMGLAEVCEAHSGHAPIGGAIVRLRGEAAVPWRRWLDEPGHTPFPRWKLGMVTTRAEQVEWVVAAGPKLMVDGRPIGPDDLLRPWAAGEFRPGGPPPTRYPYDADQTRGPRTAIGITPAGEWVLVVVDGRTEMAHSVGLTLEELARLMHALGCVHAVNLDGGGSSVMVIEGVNQLDQLKPGLASGVVSIPADPGNRERIVPVSMTVVAK